MSDKVFQAIAELIAERNDSDPAEVTRNTRFQDVGIDSLDTVEMLMNLEDKIPHFTFRICKHPVVHSPIFRGKYMNF